MAHNPSVERPSLLACFTAHGKSTLYSRGGVPPTRRDLTAVEPRRPRLGASHGSPQRWLAPSDLALWHMPSGGRWLGWPIVAAAKTQVQML